MSRPSVREPFESTSESVAIVPGAVFADQGRYHDFTLDLHTIDAVGLGTLLLALATFWLAWKTRTLAKEAEKDRKVAQEQVDAAQRQLDLSRLQLERAHRPVVVPFQRAEDVKFRGGTNPRHAAALHRESA